MWRLGAVVASSAVALSDSRGVHIGERQTRITDRPVGLGVFVVVERDRGADLVELAGLGIGWRDAPEFGKAPLPAAGSGSSACGFAVHAGGMVSLGSSACSRNGVTVVDRLKLGFAAGKIPAEGASEIESGGTTTAGWRGSPSLSRPTADSISSTSPSSSAQGRVWQTIG